MTNNQAGPLDGGRPTGTNLRLMLSNMGIRDVIVAGIFTDQCVSSTVRSLCDESFGVLVVEDCCAAATDDLHRHELSFVDRRQRTKWGFQI